MLFSEPKIPQLIRRSALGLAPAPFSALQRAENSSMPKAARVLEALADFQCSSASRKFLNGPGARDRRLDRNPFSALQRAENSSIR